MNMKQNMTKHHPQRLLGVFAHPEAICIDIGPYLHHKIEAIAAHRTQFPIQPRMLPHTILQELMGQEYFVRVSPFVAFEPEFPALQTV